ncbi:MAG: PKD domain-containing protein, partial [Ferruginibacter sp.]
MNKRLLILIIFMCVFSPVFAKHITGGEMIYDYLGPGTAANSKRYSITLRLFRDNNCVQCAVMPTNVMVAIFNNDNDINITGYINVAISSTEILPLNPLPPCITNPPDLNYSAGYYIFEVDLPENNNGFTASYQTCCRIDGIANIPDQVGATYITTIPGKNTLANAETDNSPRFSKGISVVCYNKPFTLDFSASDPDGDLLVYSLCDAYDGGDARNASYGTPAGPPFNSVQYINGFSSSQPLGPLASIDPNTGIISGIAPDAGKYVVSVCVASYRNGKFIATHRKDFIISVAACDLPGAKLVTPYYINCDSYLVNFTNLIESPLNVTFDWNFGDPGSGANNTSTLPAPGHIFSDTGIYLIKLIVNKGSPCADSATAPV